MINSAIAIYVIWYAVSRYLLYPEMKKDIENGADIFSSCVILYFPLLGECTALWFFIESRLFPKTNCN